MNRETALARTEVVFNAASDYFDAPALSFWNRFGQRTIDQLALNSGDRVLDVCCGSGASAIPAAICVGSNGQVLAVDLAESLLQLGRQKAQQQGLNHIEFRAGDFESLGLPDESFDAVASQFPKGNRLCVRHLLCSRYGCSSARTIADAASGWQAGDYLLGRERI